ncbi:cupin domain-containing protein [Spirillospora sp. NBC_01491]|uniref:cupin domain-containing protein n=1 Tax=Spirillospora sp. NBC_01491 TaxID=2976007 RepID=UPI002E329773|nr:hypothetical protein [Spirillospora sp. NBC_01491]
MTLRTADADPRGADLPWVPFTIPGSDPAVGMVRLEVDPADGSSTSLVRFPPGWTRPVAGHYACDEEFVVLEGELIVSGTAYRPGDRALIPRGTVRIDSNSRSGALALAWFAGIPRWVEGPADYVPAPSERTPLRSVRIPAGGLPLRTGTASETRLYATAPTTFGRTAAPAPAARALWLDGPHWTASAPGEPLPDRPGRVFLHLRYSN